MNKIRNIAVVGGGIAGLSAAWLLSHKHRVTLFEANDYVGGHTNTVVVDTSIGCEAVDTGFVVFNERNYPNLVALFDWLNVTSQATDMSFSVSADDGRYEYAGTNLSTLFGQRSLLFNPRHLKLLGEVFRFNHLARRELARGVDETIELGDFLAAADFDEGFQRNYLLPMGAAIWSCPLETMRTFPARSFLVFFRNHGLLNLVDRPRWRTVSGGSQSYVEKMLRRLRNSVRVNQPVRRVVRHSETVAILTDHGAEEFDDVVIGCHADQARAMIVDPHPLEAELLGAFQYQPNRAVLHSDTRLMPATPRVWSAWNYMSRRGREGDSVFVSYWMNRLQNLRSPEQLFVTLNPHEEPDPMRVIDEFTYEHPVFDAGAVKAQQRLAQIQGVDRLWFCGSYFGYGFHEDAFSSSLATCAMLGVRPPWEGRVKIDALPSRPQEVAA
jgi:predicted NAD/FAD-binding protein